MANTIDVSGLAAYAGLRDKALILQLFLGLTAAQDLTVKSGVKSKMQMTKLTVDSIMKPFSSSFTATTSGIAFSDRELVTQLGKGEMLIDVNEFRESYLEEYMPDGVAKPDVNVIPFSQYVWSQIMARAASDIDNNTVRNGVHNANGTTAKDIADGLGTILGREILAGKLTANVTGVLTQDNGVDQLEFLYKRFNAKYRRMKMYAYMSYKTWDTYREAYRKKFPNWNGDGSLVNRAIAHSDEMCFPKPCLWMGDSDRILITPKENIYMATDRLNDLNTIRAVPDVWTLKTGIAINIGFQYRDLEVIQTNDKV